MWSLIVEAGKIYHHRYGHFAHDQMVGKPWGSRLKAESATGFIYLLKPTPELWTVNLPHRTQILYLADISLISSFLELSVGSKMIECGTGSGSFSHSIVRTIAPHGHLYTFEYHQERTEKARKEFELHGLSEFITLECRNVCQDGFGLVNLVDSGKFLAMIHYEFFWIYLHLGKRSRSQKKLLM